MPALIDAPAENRSAFDTPMPPRDRRTADSGAHRGAERRQFGTVHDTGRPEVDELASAVDRYKLENRRRFITYAELYDVMISLGYDRP
ncbi:hypothetical protein [Alienimonas chondri]|uniref:Uncharacterized protein n=1 Tax=Alienimonas chondri TaxID=2681879 RepID=A0ABX1VGT1_9PLAN|nr:hypothetical protein [Alienimonas chondri]NNJ26661.1 hypothetical protein [Alienimonas chondri]